MPTWAYDDRTEDLTREYQTAGPAVIWAFCSTAVLWGSFLVFPFVVYMMSECGADGLAKPPGNNLAFWYYLLILITIGFEWRSGRYLLKPQFNTYGAFKIFGKVISFQAWLCMFGALSFVGHMDIFSTNLVYASMFKVSSTSCQQASGDHLSVSRIWSRTIEESDISMIPGAADFSVVLLVGWIFMVVQALWSLVCLIPRLPCKQNFKVYVTEDIKKFKTLWGEDISYRTAMKGLADLNRMMTVTANDLTNCRTSMKKWEPAPQLGEIRRVVWKFFFRSLLENTFFLNVQVTAWSITAAMTGGPRLRSLLFLSILCKFPPSVFPLVIESQKVYEIRKMIVTRSERPAEAWKANLYAFLYIVFAVLYFLGNGYAAVKFFMSFRCPHYMWNITGCVENL